MDKKNKKAAQRLLIIAAVILILSGAIYLGYYLYGQYAADLEDTQLSQLADASVSLTAENPIDFQTLHAQNAHIYAWIKVPGTKVDYPIVQHPENDAFYLRHSAMDKSWVSSGAIYTERSNTKSFKDRVTLIYGHNGFGDTMFTTLHRFEKADFFDSHEYFYIYMPHKKLTYQIVSAFKYDNRHIMNSFDFLDNNVFLNFADMVRHPVSGNKNVRANPETEASLEDNIVVLSTCITNQNNNRYLVCGVLVKDEKTN